LDADERAVVGLSRRGRHDRRGESRPSHVRWVPHLAKEEGS
jgi:hypothetical protein